MSGRGSESNNNSIDVASQFEQLKIRAKALEPRAGDSCKSQYVNDLGKLIVELDIIRSILGRDHSLRAEVDQLRDDASDEQRDAVRNVIKCGTDKINEIMQ